MKLRLLALFLVGSMGAQAQKAPAPTSGNPILKGWYADPEVSLLNNQYWIYPTYSALYEDQIKLDAFSSKDLITWTKHERILDTNRVHWAKYAMWAPAIIEKDKKYYLFFSANDIQDDKKDFGGIGVAVADHPGGPFKDYLGKPLIDKIINGAQPIDQFVYRDKDGTYYMYYGGWQHCNVVKLKDDFTGIVPFEDGTLYKEITPEKYTEGPFMFNRNGKYYFMWSEGGWGGPNYSVSYAIADSPLGPFKREAKILQQDSTIATSAGHHSVLHEPKSDKYFIVYHRRPLGDNGRDHRVTCIDEMHFDAAGKIIPVKMTFEGVKALPLKPSKKK
ncbi:glycosyl hydrolase family 43 [Chitinophaga skermanii]|uniref:Glycosyl hydrolase family 43 n=1 Tax=Chitinophaga skermanii TaxID=331697 RepID=A0A327PZA3_9BACT|nr:glycoside hydrolase family 43 protein [Chitinophaga skermanii]RAI97575.1 glycosyl hydrolase family 43 [Chitinophaga skermanii]